MLHGGKGTRKLRDRARIMRGGDSKNELHRERRERSKALGWCIYDYSISLQQDVGGGCFHGNQWGTNRRRTNHIFTKRNILLMPSTLSGKIRNNNIRTRLKIQIISWTIEKGKLSIYRTNGENGIKKLEKNMTTRKPSGKIQRRTTVIRVRKGGNKERERREAGGGEQEVAVSIINLVS